MFGRRSNTGIFSGLLVSFLCVFFVVCSAQADEALWGTVIETMNSGGYTYVQIERDGKKQWLALPEMLIQVGDMVEAMPGIDMGGYSSPTLGKTFDTIIFSGGLNKHVKTKTNLVRKDGGIDEEIKVEKAEGPNAFTVAEMYAKKAELDSKKVVVRAKVVKVSKFKGDTFIHLVDGSGSRKRGNHKLVAVSKDTAKKGDVLLIDGVLRADKSVGFLSYEVLIEVAGLKKQD